MTRLSPPPASSGDDPTVKTLRVLTLNVLSPAHADWERRRPVLIDGIADLRPDVVALQEVVTSQDGEQVAELLPYDVHVACHSGRSSDGVGAAIASRWPLGAVHEVDLHVTARTSDFPWCAAVVAEVRAPEPVGPFWLVHHKPNYQHGYARERELQAVAAAQFVEGLAVGHDPPVVLAGDFDDTPDSSSIRFWTGRHSLHGTSVCYEDAWAAVHGDDPGHTFSPHNPLVRAGEMALERGRRIDYIMVRCGVHGPTLDAAACALVFTRPVDGVWASDHFGVVADLVVPQHPPGTWV